MDARLPNSSPIRLFTIGAAIAALAGCQSLPSAPPPSPPLQMIRSSEFSLPPSCQASGSVVVAYTVYEDGQTGNIDVPAAPQCVQRALTEWVASFKYSPQSAQVPASIEWLLVEGR